MQTTTPKLIHSAPQAAQSYYDPGTGLGVGDFSVSKTKAGPVATIPLATTLDNTRSSRNTVSDGILIRLLKSRQHHNRVGNHKLLSTLPKRNGKTMGALGLENQLHLKYPIDNGGLSVGERMLSLSVSQARVSAGQESHD